VIKGEIKVAFVSLFAYDEPYLKIINEHSGQPDYFDEEILAKHNDPVHKWCKALLGEGIDIELWYLSYHSRGVKCFRHNYGHILRRIHATNTASYLTRYFKTTLSFRLLKELKKNQITHVLLLNYLFGNRILVDMADLLILFCRKNSINILPIYGGGSIENYGLTKKKIKAAFLRKSSAFLCQSQAEMDIMITKHNYPKEKIFLFNNPLDLKNFPQIDCSTAQKAVSLSEERIYLLFIGRLVHPKGAGHIINILPDLVKNFPNLMLIIMGTGKDEQVFRQKVKDTDMTNHVRFLGYVENTQLYYYYNAAAALVLPSYSEGVPNVILEAIACNTPVVASAVGGIPHILSDNLGILFPPKDDMALLKAIERILKNEFIPNADKRIKLLSEINIAAKGKELTAILYSVLAPNLSK
jgi:glycosyltransferase involved in cell wall biosynthesis